MTQQQISGQYEHLIVGNETCSFLEVCDILSNSPSVGVLWSKLIDVARSLILREEILIRLKIGLTTGQVTYNEALYQILEAWRGQHSIAATLHNLISVLERNQLTDCANALRNRFGVA